MSYTIPYRVHHNHTPERPIQVHGAPEQVATLVQDGYLVFPAFFEGEPLQQLRNALDEVCIREGHEIRSGKNWGGIYLRHLMEKHPAFLELFRLEPFLSLSRAALGPQVQVLPMTARVAYPDTDGQATPWHIHQRVVPSPRPPLFSLPHVFDALIYLDEVTEASGPLCFVPDSHCWEDREFPGGPHDPIEGEVQLTFPAGTVVLIHGNLWHRALAPKPDSGIRRMLILPYTHVWNQFPSFGERPKNGLMAPLFENPDTETRELLGIPDGIY